MINPYTLNTAKRIIMYNGHCSDLTCPECFLFDHAIMKCSQPFGDYPTMLVDSICKSRVEKAKEFMITNADYYFEELL